jgi:predicted nucleotidyltransferase
MIFLKKLEVFLYGLTMKSSTEETKFLELLKDYFKERRDIAFAFLFGSTVKGRIHKGGDVDVAIYFTPEKDVEWEAFNKRYEGESRIALDLERLLKREVDLVVLNRAKAILADEIIRSGEPIIIRDRGIFIDFLCIVTDEAEFMRGWLESSFKEKRFASNR